MALDLEQLQAELSSSVENREDRSVLRYAMRRRVIHQNEKENATDDRHQPSNQAMLVEAAAKVRVRGQHGLERELIIGGTPRRRSVPTSDIARNSPVLILRGFGCASVKEDLYRRAFFARRHKPMSHLYGFDLSMIRRDVQWRPSVIVRCLDVCASVKEDLRRRPFLAMRRRVDGPLLREPLRTLRPCEAESVRKCPSCQYPRLPQGGSTSTTIPNTTQSGCVNAPLSLQTSRSLLPNEVESIRFCRLPRRLLLRQRNVTSIPVIRNLNRHVSTFTSFTSLSTLSRLMKWTASFHTDGPVVY